mgnify:FL=1|jgi:hypothetical protein
MDKIELERIHKEWQDKKIPDFAEKEEFVSYLAQMFLSTQMKNFGLNSYIENYVNTHFTKYKNRNWAVAIKTIRENYKFFRLLGWTEIDYIKCLSLIVILNKVLTRKNLNMIYNDYKAGLYDDYFDEV